MLTDKDGIKITPVQVIKFSNEATVRYPDGTEKKISLDDIKADSRIEWLESLRKVRIDA